MYCVYPVSICSLFVCFFRPVQLIWFALPTNYTSLSLAGRPHQVGNERRDDCLEIISAFMRTDIALIWAMGFNGVRKRCSELSGTNHQPFQDRASTRFREPTRGKNVKDQEYQQLLYLLPKPKVGIVQEASYCLLLWRDLQSFPNVKQENLRRCCSLTFLWESISFPLAVWVSSGKGLVRLQGLHVYQDMYSREFWSCRRMVVAVVVVIAGLAETLAI